MIHATDLIDLAFRFGSRGEFPPQAGSTSIGNAMMAQRCAKGMNWE
jgi:hypothetical protein